MWTKHAKLKVREVTLDNLFAALQIIMVSSVLSCIQQNVDGLHIRWHIWIEFMQRLAGQFWSRWKHFLELIMQQHATYHKCQFQPETSKAQKILSTTCWKS